MDACSDVLKPKRAFVSRFVELVFVKLTALVLEKPIVSEPMLYKVLRKRKHESFSYRQGVVILVLRGKVVRHMGTAASVFEIEALSDAATEINQIKDNTVDVCNDGLCDAQQLVEDTQNEEQTSGAMLDAAKGIEALTHGVVIELEVELAAAMAELAAVSPNPVAMAAVGAKIGEIESKLGPAREEYKAAVEHREALERRYEMAVKCVELAKERFDTLQMHFESRQRSIEAIVDKGCVRLNMAHQDLEQYVARLAPDVRSSLDRWFNEKPEENIPVRPNEIRDKLDVDDTIVTAILEYLYATDMGFRANVDGYCHEMKSGNETGAELKIKKQMVGRLCEEIVIKAFRPISTQISTQSRESLPDGRYTKVDMIVYGLTHPLVLGRGEGMGAREGGSLAVEVKSGHSSYLYQQLTHMQDQAFGHQHCDASCVICTRDIHDLSPEKENELREKLREAGSPMIGMLPRKDELDNRCINFVKGKLNDV
ncbi:hypothetical protein [uncultured Megasphaera sp.]|uniref:hypothetical protein n=1 Tax=Megasphaera massiliensis TaxID=1232428 RepID=UPI00266C9EBD|nr:hypothetical protein [uncultured Megasphaera sp.]